MFGCVAVFVICLGCPICPGGHFRNGNDEKRKEEKEAK